MNGLEEVAAQWYLFGLQLGIKTGTLDAIQGGRDKISMIFLQVLRAWLEDPKVLSTKEELITILKSPTIRNTKLARKISSDEGELTLTSM